MSSLLRTVESAPAAPLLAVPEEPSCDPATHRGYRGAGMPDFEPYSAGAPGRTSFWR